MSEKEKAPTWKEPEGNHYGMRRDPDGDWVSVDDYDALRARVAELEGEVQRLCLSLTHEGPDLTKRVLDRAIAARGKPLLPAPAPGRDTAGRGTTTGGTDAA